MNLMSLIYSPVVVGCPPCQPLRLPDRLSFRFHSFIRSVNLGKLAVKVGKYLTIKNISISYFGINYDK
jgi:hypothetical protein